MSNKRSIRIGPAGWSYKDWEGIVYPQKPGAKFGPLAYNYLYSLEELEPWITRIKEVAAQTQESYVITNNHFRGQAVVNALEMKATLTEKRVVAPAPLFEKYPALEDSAVPEAEADDSEPRLFR